VAGDGQRARGRAGRDAAGGCERPQDCAGGHALVVGGVDSAIGPKLAGHDDEALAAIHSGHGWRGGGGQAAEGDAHGASLDADAALELRDVPGDVDSRDEAAAAVDKEVIVTEDASDAL